MTTGIVTWIYAILLVYFVSLHLSYLILFIIGIADNRRRNRELRATDMRAAAASPLTIPVSVLVPAHNEEGSILNTVQSILASDFPEFEVIVVDDGSTDRTFEVLDAEFDLLPEPIMAQPVLPTAPLRQAYVSRRDPRLRVLQQENGGKASALNAALNAARYRYIVQTDADGAFAPDALLRMIRLANIDAARIVGVGVTLRALNGHTSDRGCVGPFGMPPEWLVRFQMLEYSSVFLANRVGWSALNAVPVLSGGAALWRRDALLEIGGMSTETTHEDLDATLRVHEYFRRAGRDYRIIYVPDPVVWTEVPHTWSGLRTQRKRWQRTLYEGVWRQRRMWFNPRYGTVGLLQMPYLLLYEALGPFMELLAWVITAVVLVFGLADPLLAVAFLLLAAGLTSLVRLASLTADAILYHDYSVTDVLRLSAAALLEFWVFRPFLLVARIPAFFEFLRGHTQHERAERSARAQEPAAR